MFPQRCAAKSSPKVSAFTEGDRKINEATLQNSSIKKTSATFFMGFSYRWTHLPSARDTFGNYFYNKCEFPTVFFTKNHIISKTRRKLTLLKAFEFSKFSWKPIGNFCFHIPRSRSEDAAAGAVAMIMEYEQELIATERAFLALRRGWEF